MSSTVSWSTSLKRIFRFLLKNIRFSWRFYYNNELLAKNFMRLSQSIIIMLHPKLVNTTPRRFQLKALKRFPSYYKSMQV